MKQKNHLSFVFLLFILFSLNSHCLAQRLPEEQLRFHRDYTENGLLFGTITFPDDKMRFDNYTFPIVYISPDKKLQRKYTKNLRIDPTMFVGKHYGELDGGRTYLFVLEKVPGLYNLSSAKFTIFKLFDYAPQYKNVSTVTSNFEVNKGEIIYIGNININEYANKGERVINFEDKFERDKKAMKDLYKMVNWDLAKNMKIELNTNMFENISNH